jgi:hypothetical protein
MLKFIVNKNKKQEVENTQFFQDLLNKITALEQLTTKQEERIKSLEEIVFALKENVKEEKQQAKLQQKKKWLTSYPDETK